MSKGVRDNKNEIQSKRNMLTLHTVAEKVRLYTGNPNVFGILEVPGSDPAGNQDCFCACAYVGVWGVGCWCPYAYTRFLHSAICTDSAIVVDKSTFCKNCK